MQHTPHQFKPGDTCFVRYGYGDEKPGQPKVFEGKVLWTQKGFCDAVEVIVRPNDSKFIFTFGSSHDMANGYKTYFGQTTNPKDDIFCRVWPTFEQAVAH
jgi:hypothetical protein